MTIVERAPDTTPWFAAAAVNSWWDQYIETGGNNKPLAVDGTRFRSSDAGKCSRYLAYKFAGLESSDPPSVADTWRMATGTLTHNLVQPAIERVFPGSRSEVKVRHKSANGSGSMDCLVSRTLADGRPWVSSVEIKSVGRFKFEAMTIGARGKRPEGPSWSWVTQAAINAASIDPVPDDVVIAAFALELIGADRVERLGIGEFGRFCAQWTFTRDEFTEIAERELRRVDGIMQRTDADGPQSVERRMADPRYGRNRVKDPAQGLLTILDGAGEPAGKDVAWECGYCMFQSQCVADLRAGS